VVKHTRQQRGAPSVEGAERSGGAEDSKLHSESQYGCCRSLDSFASSCALRRQK
jgi:hypothetical protein